MRKPCKWLKGVEYTQAYQDCYVSFPGMRLYLQILAVSSHRFPTLDHCGDPPPPACIYNYKEE